MDLERIKRPWEEQYSDDDVETMPWFCPHLDRDVAWAIETLPIAPAKALDLGCGPGTQAIELSRLGFETTGADISPSAVRKADERARKEGVAVTFICDDILNTQLSDTYGVIMDRGCFHVLDVDQRPNYLRSVVRLLDGNGYLLLKTFHKQETCEVGPPNRFEAADIAKIFSDTFELVECRDSFFESTMDSNPKALFCILKRKMEDK
ncbi:MAG: class I SAM-dependent methyltransferase [Mariprofundaceae bacterium]|nr:class I SAM-dependent methyltransferase [Mariprofundaceae bacterium]